MTLDGLCSTALAVQCALECDAAVMIHPIGGDGVAVSLDKRRLFQIHIWHGEREEKYVTIVDGA